MSDIHEHNLEDHEDPLPGPSWMIGILGTILLVVIVLGLSAMYYDAYSRVENQAVITAMPQELLDLNAEQQKRLDTAHKDIFDEEIALVIPIEKAMELVADEYGTSR